MSDYGFEGTAALRMPEGDSTWLGSVSPGLLEDCHAPSSGVVQDTRVEDRQTTEAKEVMGSVLNLGQFIAARQLASYDNAAFGSKGRFELLQQFEGTVLGLEDGVFRARLADRTNPNNPLECADFDLEDVSEGDRALLVPGAVFYWSIGYRVHPWGQRERSSVLKFRRLPVWTRKDLAAVQDLARDWKYMLNGSDDDEI